jgi:hypothetical protein
MEILLKCQFSNGADTMFSFDPTVTNVDEAVNSFVKLHEAKTNYLTSPILSKYLVRKSDVRPLRKFKLSVYVNKRQIRTAILDVPHKAGMFKDSEAIKEAFMILAYRGLEVGTTIDLLANSFELVEN